jgi:putative nucleotidyltransferase with HDIG domain
VTGPSEETAAKRRVRRLKNLPTLPDIVVKITKLMENPDTSAPQVGALIGRDQVLSAKVLRLANSAFYGQSRKISSIDQALVVLGFDAVRGLILSTSAFDLMARGIGGLWEHSLGCAAAAGAIARHLGRGDAEEIWIAGLLHDLGKVVLSLQAPEDLNRVLAAVEEKKAWFIQGEKALLGYTHDQVGLWLAEHWNLPVNLAEPIRFHHFPDQAENAPDQTAIVHLANIVIRARGFGFAGDPYVPPLSRRAFKRLGLTPKDFDPILDALEPKLANLTE